MGTIQTTMKYSNLDTPSGDLAYEAERFLTFKDVIMWLPATLLSDRGFFYNSQSKKITCFSCKFEHKPMDLDIRHEPSCNLSQNNFPFYVENYEQFSSFDNPSCSFLATVLELPDAIPTLNMIYEQNRLKTFANVSTAFAVCSKALSQNGFYFTGPNDKVCCINCKCELSNWKKEDNIRQRHQNQTPNCHFVGNNESTNTSHYRSNVILDRPKHPQFALLNDRLKTFTNWPRDKKQTPQLLAEAGFYHTAETDTVICYCCDGGLCNWDEDDDPWIEHARWYPRCTYIRQRKGDQFVDSLKEDEFSYSFDTDNVDNDPNDIDTVKANPTDSGGQGPTLNSGSEFAKASVFLEAVVKYIEEVGPVVSKNQQEEVEQPDALVNQQDDFKLDDKLREENCLLKEQKTCKICLDEDVNIVFIPCGHFVSCATCAPSLKTCPLCHSQILDLVRAYMP